MYKNNTRKVNNFLPDILINEDSKDKLFSYASSHNLPELENFITTNSISLEVKNNNNQSITHVLLLGESTIDENELLRCIKFLVERGAPISIIDNSNLTPLFICIKKNYPKIFKYLLDKGASLDINTYDNLTVLHEIVKPEYTTYDANGIQSIIPDKLPKITMEGYETVYTEILNVIENKLANDNTLKTNFDKFKTIAKQFYYNDDNDEKEDFNNVLLEEEASDNPSIKDDLFKKLKNQLEIFYSSDEIEDVDNADLVAQLNNIANELNKEFKVEKMHGYNDIVLNAIKSIAYSLELSIHFFFNKRLQEIEALKSIIKSPTNISIFSILNEFNTYMNTLPGGIKIRSNLLTELNNNQNPNEIEPPDLTQLKNNLLDNKYLYGQNIITLATLFKLIQNPIPQLTPEEQAINNALNLVQNNTLFNLLNQILNSLNQIKQNNDGNGNLINTLLKEELTSELLRLPLPLQPGLLRTIHQNVNNLITHLPNGQRLTYDDIATIGKLSILIMSSMQIPNINGHELNPIPGPTITPPIEFTNNDYNNLITLYKLDNITNIQQINKNSEYIFNHDNSKKRLINELNFYISGNTIPRAGDNSYLTIYNLESGNQYYCIDYFNLLHTFNEFARTYNQLQNDITNPFELYQNIQEIYKYNYIIYIFEKERKKILNLKNYKHDNIELKKHLDNYFNTTFKELENSVNLIKEQLEKIKNLSNEYIDIYNKINGHKIYTPNTNPIYIGIYPQIQFPTKIKYTKNDEDAKIRTIDNYIKYNKDKNNFFHNFVLYFQDIGICDTNVNGTNNLLNNIINIYNIDINDYNQCYYDIFANVEELNQNNQNNQKNKNKAYKLYFYDPTYLKLEKQRLIDTLLVDPQILGINIPKFDTYKNEIATKLKEEIKKKILNEILQETFNNILVLEINNFFKNKLADNTEELTYKIQIKEPDLNAMLIASTGFSNILIPNYEFKNNKFLSISKNKFVDLTLYFDTNYFKINNLKTLKYYKKNDFINDLLNNNKSLLFKMDNKDWTPIYYAIDGNNYEVIKKILEIKEIDTIRHYDHKKISPLKLCINKQLNHLDYLLTDDNKIHYLDHYINMLRNELQSNDLLIPLNIDSVFIIALFIQNHIWLEKASGFNFKNINVINSRKKQIDEEYNNMKKKSSDVNNNDFKYGSDDKNNIIPDIEYKEQKNTDYNYNDTDEINIILKKYYDKAKNLETKDFGSYGSYWKKYDKKNKIKNILEHINESINFKNILNKYIKEEEEEEVKFDLPTYNIDNIDNIKKLKSELKDIKQKLERYLKFINIRFNSNKDNYYTEYLNKIYVHVLANIIGVYFYLTMEELIVKHYINLNIDIDPANTTDINPVKEQLKNLNNLLINNKLDESNINYKYIIATKNPELVLKKDIIDILNNEFIPNNEELIATYETIVLPRYRELYKITYKYLQMFISNYHKFIYNQYHGLEILLLLLDKISS
jgi:hypothetical protein